MTGGGNRNFLCCSSESRQCNSLNGCSNSRISIDQDWERGLFVLGRNYAQKRDCAVQKVLPWSLKLIPKRYQKQQLTNTIITWRNNSETCAVKYCQSYTKIKTWEAYVFQHPRYFNFLQRWLSLSSQDIIFCPKVCVAVGVSTKNCCNLWSQRNPKTAGDDPLHVWT